jgi:hypothetical protein
MDGVKATKIGLAVLGGLIIAAHSGADILGHLGYRLGECVPTVPTGFPWTIAIMATVCILPITIGPKAASVVIEGAVNLIPGRRKNDSAAATTVRVEETKEG